MGMRESSDPIVIQSSIALLQERFRQLQRVKEMRQERELLRNLSDVPKPYDVNNPAMKTQHDYEPIPSGFFFHFLPPKSPPRPQPQQRQQEQLFSNVLSDSQSNFKLETPILTSLLDADRHQPRGYKHNVVSACKFETSSDSDDLDTSLHL